MSVVDATTDPADAIIKSLRDERDRDPSLHRMVSDTEPRTLVLLGPSRAGKSTIVRVLSDSLYRPPKPQLYSATRQSQHQLIGGLRIVDMPGFYDKQKQSSSFSLTNETIFKQLQDLMSTVPVDLYAFVFSLISGINDEDIQSMLTVKGKLPHISERMMLVVTHCEELHQDEKDTLINNFFNYRDVVHHDLRNFFKQGIFFIGCIRYESLKHPNQRALTLEHANVLRMRDMLINKCLQTSCTMNDNNNHQPVRTNCGVAPSTYQQDSTHNVSIHEQNTENSSFHGYDCCYRCFRSIVSCGKVCCMCCIGLCVIGLYYVNKRFFTAPDVSVTDKKIAD